MPQSPWQQRVFEDVLKERLYQERKWGQDVDDTLNTPWMWCAYLCSYATKWMQNRIAGRAEIPKNSTTG
jgi:phosphoserine aminotransferase